MVAGRILAQGEGMMTRTIQRVFGLTLLAVGACLEPLNGAQIVTNPFVGVTLITRTETLPRR